MIGATETAKVAAGRLPRLLGVPGPAAATTLASTIAIGVLLASHQLLETARDSLFLASIPARELPWMYLVIALMGMAVAWRHFAGWGTRPRRLTLLLWGAAGVTLTLWSLAAEPDRWVLYALYIWTGLLATVAVTSFWLMLATLFDATTAKRVFTVVGSGAIVGAISGSLLARILTEWTQTRHTIAAAAVLLVVAGALPLVLAGWGKDVREPTPDADRLGVVDAVREAWGQRYPPRLAGLTLASVMTLTVVDLAFKSVVAATVDPASLGTFFATVHLCTNIASLLTQLFVVRWLLRSFSLTTMIVVTPVLIFGGSAFLAATGALAGAVALKSLDGTLRHSLHRTTSELLYVPMHKRVREATKLILDVGAQRGGQALASVLILVLVAWREPTPHTLAAIGGVGALAWIALGIGMERSYLDLFRRTLGEASIQTQVDFPALDVQSLRSLLHALGSEDDREVLAALNLLVERGTPHLIPELILYHPNPAIVARALAIFSDAGGTSFLRLAKRLLSHPHPELRAAALRARLPGASSLLLAKLVADPSPIVRVTARVGACLNDDAGTDAMRSLEEAVASADAPTLSAALQAIQLDGRRFLPILQRLASHEDAEIRGRVALIAEKFPHPELLPELIGMLVCRQTRLAARAALVAAGSAALDRIEASLRDPATSPELRAHLPRTLSRFDDPRASTLLTELLRGDPDPLFRRKALRGLNQLRDLHPGLAVPQEELRAAAREAAVDGLRALHLRLELTRALEEDPSRRNADTSGLVDLLCECENESLENTFRLIGALYPGEAFESIYRGLGSGRARIRASSRELVVAIVEGELRAVALCLIDEAPDVERLRLAAEVHPATPLSYEEVLATLAEAPWDVVRWVTLAAIGTHRLHALLPVVERAAREGAPNERAVAEIAQRALGAHEPEDREVDRAS